MFRVYNIYIYDSILCFFCLKMHYPSSCAWVELHMIFLFCFVFVSYLVMNGVHSILVFASCLPKVYICSIYVFLLEILARVLMYLSTFCTYVYSPRRPSSIIYTHRNTYTFTTQDEQITRCQATEETK